MDGGVGGVERAEIDVEEVVGGGVDDDEELRGVGYDDGDVHSGRLEGVERVDDRDGGHGIGEGGAEEVGLRHVAAAVEGINRRREGHQPTREKNESESEDLS